MRGWQLGMIPYEGEVNQVLQTKECLYDALFQLLKSTPYSSVTVGQICRKADFSRAVFYNHYHNKDEFLREIFDRIVAYYHVKIEQADKAGVLNESYTHTIWLKILRRNKDFFLLLDDIGKQDWLTEHLTREYDNLYPRMSHSKQTDNMVFREYFLAYHATGVAGLYIKWLKQDDPLPPDEFAKIIMHLYQYKNIRSFLSFLGE